MLRFILLLFFIFGLFFVTKNNLGVVVFGGEETQVAETNKTAKEINKPKSETNNESNNETDTTKASRANVLSIIKGVDFYDVNIGDKLFARYVKNFDGAPIIYPIYGDDGKLMTRGFPMNNHNAISKDHVHHRSFWFSHGRVNDTDFWLTDKKLKNIGKIAHKKFLEAKIEGNTAIIVTENDWVNQRGEVICSDVRAFDFGITSLGNRYIDFAITVTAKMDEVIFYDTKEGTFGVRVADFLAVDIARAAAKKKMNKEAKNKKNSIINYPANYPASYIVNAEGKFNEEAWGKRSAWVDYVGQFEKDADTTGIAILNHPASFRYPTYWHVRTYGLFAANPFCEREFGIRKKSEQNNSKHNNNNNNDSGNFVMKKNESFTLFYRIIFHNNDTKKAAIADEFKNYSTQKLKNKK
ncbi:MAG: PmoA family protein [Planctomycetaceae bacterium]|nr:PmoA family protein [Planctomycetaceae bacterium]